MGALIAVKQTDALNLSQQNKLVCQVSNGFTKEKNMHILSSQSADFSVTSIKSVVFPLVTVRFKSTVNSINSSDYFVIFPFAGFNHHSQFGL